MYVMYTPPGGVDVSLNSYTWTVDADAKIPPTPAPASWSNWGGAAVPGNGITTNAAQRQTQFPNWAQIANPNW